MKLNVGLKEFKKKYNQKRSQVLYYKIKSKNSLEIENLINNFLEDENSFLIFRLFLNKFLHYIYHLSINHK